MSFTVGQVPVQPLLLTIVDGSVGVDPSTYDTVTVLLRNPEGQPVSTAAGQTSVVGGKVRYAWPTTTLFATPGDYALSIRAARGSAVDFTEALTIPVRREGGPS